MAQIGTSKGRLGAWKQVVFLGLLVLAGGLSVRVGEAQAFADGDRSARVADALFASSSTSEEPLASAPNAATTSSAILAVPPPLPARASDRVRPFSRIAMGADTGSLGFGAQFTTPITRWLNLRGGLDLANFGYRFEQDGVRHAGTLQLRSGSVRLELFPFRTGFHISPGFVFFKSSIGGSIAVPGGNSFSMGNATLISNPANPVTGGENLVFTRSVLPSLTIGFHNTLERKSRRWSLPLEVGAAYTGHYSAQIQLMGSACYKGYCVPTSNAMVQASVVQQQNNLDEVMKHYQILPIVTGGVAYRF